MILKVMTDNVEVWAVEDHGDPGLLSFLVDRDNHSETMAEDCLLPGILQ